MKRDHVKITYYDIRYPYYKEPGYDYIDDVKIKVRKYKKSYRRFINDYWDSYWDAKYYVYGYWYYLSKPCDYPRLPKLKRHIYVHRGCHKQLNCCPKNWNKLVHIRPNRREWKRFCQQVTIQDYLDCLYPEWFDFNASEGIPYPSSRKHIYYY